MDTKLPFYAKLAFILIIVCIIFYGIYIGQSILVPLGFSFLIAVLLHPLENLFVRKKIPRIFAILFSLLIAVIVLYALFALLSYQIGSFVDDVPSIKQNLSNFFNQCQTWISNTFHFSKQQQQQVIEDAKTNGLDNAKTMAGTTLGIVTASLATIALVPIYVFLFMFYRNHLIMFIVSVFNEKHSSLVSKVIQQIKTVIQGYVSGLLIETSCVAVLNSVGLLLIGAPYAILLGIIGAILNLIPYLGGLIALLLTGIVTLSNTGDSGKMIGALGVYLTVQLIDNNFLVPRIIGSSVQLNALVSIIGVLIGGTLCGIGGMFLSLPFIAICKVVFDHVEDLQPWGKLLGDEKHALWGVIKRIKRKPAVPKTVVPAKDN